MAKNEANVAWTEVDTGSFDKPLKAAYGELKAAQQVAKEKKATFEAAFVTAAQKAEAIDDDQTLMFSYRFGKLSVAPKAIEEKPKATAKPKFRF